MLKCGKKLTLYFHGLKKEDQPLKASPLE